MMKNLLTRFDYQRCNYNKVSKSLSPLEGQVIVWLNLIDYSAVPSDQVTL